MAIDNNRSIVDVLQDILANLQGLIRSEVKLAKTEIKEEARKASRAAVVMAAGGVAALYAVWLLLLTIFFALAIAIPLWASALVLFVVTGILAAILLAAGKKRFQTVQPKPEKTIETVKENVEWMKQQTK